MMTKVNEIAKIIKNNFNIAPFGCFFSRNVIDDEMETIYIKSGQYTIDICRGYGYFEIFGLTDAEQIAIKKYYKKLKNMYSL